MKKIGLLVLAIVLAMGALGVGYAAWTDTITINGTVNTGNVDLQVVDYSGTWVYKDLDNDACVIYNWKLSPAQETAWNKVLVAYASAEQTLDGTGAPVDDSVTVTFDNAFPLGEALEANILIHDAGSIPVMVDALITGTTGDAADLALLEQIAEFHFYWSDVNGTQGVEITDVVQLHYCDYVLCVMTLDIPQDDAYMDLDGGFTAQIRAVQWNEPGYWNT